MKKIISIICLILILTVPTCVKATSENELLQMQEETNKLIESIESQKLDESRTTAFVYAIFIIVALSMIFEAFVRGYREELRKKKEEQKPAKDIRIKLLITYVIHMMTVIITWLICTYALYFTEMYTWFLIAITFYIVEIAPLFTIRLKINKKED